jgi:hypothetical protein
MRRRSVQERRAVEGNGPVSETYRRASGPTVQSQPKRLWLLV